MADKQIGTNVIQAAGGLVWRDSAQGKKIAVIYRGRYGDWTLPKGKLKPGERWQDAALREVAEETGCKVQLGSFAGSHSYLVDDVPKVVLFWNMILIDEGEFKPSEEVKQLIWLSIPEALKRVDYDDEKSLIADTQTRLKKDWPLWWSRIEYKLFPNSQYTRLVNTFSIYRVEIKHLISQAEKKGLSNSLWVEAILTLLENTEQALETRQIDLGWSCLNAVRRMELLGLAEVKPNVLQTRAQAILQEASDKLSSWRKETVEGLLLDKEGQLNQKITIDELVYASQILHEHYDNVYRKLWAVKRQLITLAIITLIAIIIWIILAPPLTDTRAPIDSSEFLISVVLFGIMGASVSGILSLTKDTIGSRIPDQLVNSWITLARIVIGSVASLVIYTFLISGLLQIGSIATPSLILAVSFASGFSERLVTRAVESVAR